MQSQINTDALVELSDFSSALLRADSERSTNNNSNDYANRGIEANRNLSSAIAGIRDEGSALPVPRKKVRKMPTRSSVTEFAKRARETVIQQEKRNTSTASVSPGIMSAKIAASSMKNSDGLNNNSSQVQDAPRKPTMNKTSPAISRSRQHMVMLLTTSLFVGLTFVVFQLFAQPDDLQQTSTNQANKANVVNEVVPLASDMSIQYENLQTELQEMKQVLHSIKANFDEIDSMNMQAEMEEIVQDVTTIKTNMLKTQKELGQMKASLDQETAGTDSQLTGSEALSSVSKVNQVQKNTANAENNAAVKMISKKVENKKITSVKLTSDATTRTRNWVATLGSFGSHALAQAASENYKKGGLVLDIEQAVVRDNTFYRIGRAGFPTREDAKAFIARFESTTGTKGGWVHLKKPGL